MNRHAGFDLSLSRVVLPQDNKSDLRDVPEHVRNEMEFVFVERVEQVVAAVLAPGRRKRANGIAPENAKTNGARAATTNGGGKRSRRPKSRVLRAHPTTRAGSLHQSSHQRGL